MNTTPNLIERLRHGYPSKARIEAADLLEAQAFDLDIQAGSIEAVQAANNSLCAQIEAKAKQIEALQAENTELREALKVAHNAGLVGALKEAAAFIHAVHTGEQPIVRYPLPDELDGFAAMVDALQAKLSEAQETNQKLAGREMVDAYQAVQEERDALQVQLAQEAPTRPEGDAERQERDVAHAHALFFSSLWPSAFSHGFQVAKEIYSAKASQPLTAQVQPASEPEVWFCPACGVASEALLKCCPDWLRARKVPLNYREIADCAIAALEDRKGILCLDVEEELEEEIRQDGAGDIEAEITKEPL